MNIKKYDLIIVGAGPTGIQVAIEAKKAGLNSVVLEKGALVDSIYHFPINMTFFSTSEKLEIADVPFMSNNARPTRQEAMEYYRRLMTHYNLSINLYEEVSSVTKQADGSFSLVTTKGSYTSQYVVIATGFYGVPNYMNVPGENLPHVSHYYDDPHKYIGQKVVVVGAANSACDAALETWQKGADVTMLIRGEGINERVKYWIRPNIINRIEEGSIQAEFNITITKITQDKIYFTQNGEEKSIKADHILAMTGYSPDYKFLRNAGVEINRGNDKVPNCMKENLESNVDGLYLAGVVNCGMVTHKLFIENTRDHGTKIISDILKKSNN